MNFFKRTPKTAKQTESKGPKTSPFTDAKQHYSSQAAAQIAQSRIWQLIGLFSLLITLVAVAGIIYIGSQSKFVPYIVEIDRIGHQANAGPLRATTTVDPRVLRASVGEFVVNLKTVTIDVELQRNFILSLYSHLKAKDPATVKITEIMENPTTNPFKRAERTLVSVTIDSIIQQTGNTWQVDWVETVRDRQGALQGQPVRMRGLVTVYVGNPPTDNQAGMIYNPLGIFVRDISMQRL